MTKQAAYRERIANGRRVFALDLVEVDVEYLLIALGYLKEEGFTRREADEALAQFVNMLAAATGNDARYEFLLRQAIEIFQATGDDVP